MPDAPPSPPQRLTRRDLETPENIASLKALSDAELRIRLGILIQVAQEFKNDPRLKMDGGINDQIEVLQSVIKSKPPAQIVGLKTLDLRGEIKPMN